MRIRVFGIVAAVAFVAADAPWTPAGAQTTLLNVSYDPTRELYRDLNVAFTRHYAEEHGRGVTIKQSHAATGSKARAVIDGLDADVVTLAVWPDVDAVAKAGLTRLERVGLPAELLADGRGSRRQRAGRGGPCRGLPGTSPSAPPGG